MRIAAHYRQLETSGRRDKPGYGKPLSANTVSKVHVLLARRWTSRVQRAQA